SRYHQGMIASLAPWLMPSVEELARGVDVKAIDDNTVALVRAGADPKETGLQVQLIFATDGRLAERRLVLMPKQEILAKVVYDGQGATKITDGKDKLWAEQTIKTIEATAPDLKPNLKDLVVLPLPLRTQAKVAPKIDRYEDLPEDQAVALL